MFWLKKNTLLLCNYYVKYEGFPVYPVWDIVHMFLYSLIPGTIMLIFNILLIKHVIVKRVSSNKQPTQKLDKKVLRNLKRKRLMTISLIITTFIYFSFSLPTGIYFGFISPILIPDADQTNYLIGYVFDTISYINSSSIFFVLYFSNVRFRTIVNYNVFKLIMMCLRKKMPENSRSSSQTNSSSILKTRNIKK